MRPETTRPSLAVPCRSCRYDLTGLDPRGNCPECNTPVGRSLAIAIGAAPPNYLKTIRLGARLQRAASWLMLLSFGWLVLQEFAAPLILRFGSALVVEHLRLLMREPPPLYPVIKWGVGIAALGYFAAAGWLLSARLPGVSDADQPKRRIMLRTWLIIALALLGTHAGLGITPMNDYDDLLLRLIVGAALAVASAILLLASGPLNASLGERIPNSGVVAAAKRHHIMVRMATGVVIIGWPAVILLSIVTSGRGFAALGLGTIATVIGTLALAAVSLSHMSMSKRLHRAVANTTPEPHS